MVLAGYKRVLIASGAAGALVLAGSPIAGAQEGSLYPDIVNVNASEISQTLGAAGYILTDIGQDEEFRGAIVRAVAKHPNFHAQVSETAQARAETKAARSALYPRLSANVNGDYVIARQFGAATDNVVESLKPKGQLNVGATVSQLIFDGGATFARIRSAKARDEESAKSMDARINDLALSTLSAYYDVAAHQAIVALGRDFVTRHESLLADVEERERQGVGTKTDVLRAKARLSSARARVAQIEESASIADIRYVEFFGERPAGHLRLPSFEALVVGSQEEAVAMAQSRNPLLAAASARTKGARADFKAAKASRLPEVRATVSGVKFDVLDDSSDYDVRAGVDLSYDLYAGGSRGAAISSARSAAERQHFEEEQVKREIAREAAIAFEQKRSADVRLEILSEAAVAQSKARDLIAERFRVARGDLFDRLQAENDWFEANVAYLSGLVERDMASYQLMEFTGDLLRFFSPQSDYQIAELSDGAADE